MEGLALSVSQMERLEALGVDTGFACMSYLYVSGEWELRYADAACRATSSLCYRPAFLLHDLLQVLPPVLRVGDTTAVLHIFYLPDGRVHVHYGSVLSVPVGMSLLDSLYTLLCKVLEFHPEALSSSNI